MKKCSYCGVEYPDEAEMCSIDQQPLLEIKPTTAPQADPVLITAKTINTSPVRFIRREEAKTKSAGFVGKGTLKIVEGGLLLEGKKQLSLGAQVLIFVGINAVFAIMGKLIIGIPLAILVDVFARVQEKQVISNDSIISLKCDLKSGCFALTATTKEKRPLHIAWKTNGDAKILFAEFQRQLGSALHEEKVRGSFTF